MCYGELNYCAIFNLFLCVVFERPSAFAPALPMAANDNGRMKPIVKVYTA